MYAKETYVGIEETRDLYRYDDGIYVPGKFHAESEAQNLLDIHTRKMRISEIINYLILNLSYSLEDFDSRPDVLNLKNGLLNLETGQFCEHDEHYPCFVQLPVKFDPFAGCPGFEKFISEILHEDDIPTMQELFGYCLYKKMPFHKAFMLIGNTRNGKTTLIKVLRRFLGKKNCSEKTLQQITMDKFATADLVGKLANLCDDLPSKKIQDVGIFKMLTSGSEIDAQKKNKDPFSYVPYLKMINATNEIPQTKSMQEAYFTRWILFDFPNSFPDGDPKQDPELIDKITTEEELSGILNWSIEGLHRLLEQGHFTNNKSAEEVREAMLKSSDSIAAFVQDWIENDTEGVIDKNFFYTAYLIYCKENKIQVESKNIFFRQDRLNQHAPFISHGETKIGKRRQVIRGAKLNIPVNIMEKHEISEGSEGYNTLIETHVGTRGNNTVIKKQPLEPLDHDDNVITCNILEGLPQITGVDEKTYGPFKAGATVSLPAANAKALINAGGAQLADNTFDILPQRERLRGIVSAIRKLSNSNGNFAKLKELGKALSEEYKQNLIVDIEVLKDAGKIYEPKIECYAVVP